MPALAPATMTERERYLATLLFQKPDRVPFTPGYGRRSTLDNWRRQGLPADVKDYHAYIRELLGIEPLPLEQPVRPGMVTTMLPEFEEKILEHRPGVGGAAGTYIVQDWKGNVCEISDEFDPTYLRGGLDFVTRSWIKCPVESRGDWPDMARRYVANDPARFPKDFQQRCAQLKDRSYVSGIVFSGPFWQLREWLGFEQLCMLLLDDPDFAMEMALFWRDYMGQMLQKLFRHHVPDYVFVNEDMAYKEKAMISPEMCRRFLMPAWRTWGELCRGAGVPLYMVDSDGYVGDLIPVWIDAGFQVNSPQEVAAGNDLPAYRQQYGTKMGYMGGVDKRAMARGGQAIRDEISRLQPAIDAGGYIPSCDHGVPHDVSWPDFLEYCRLLARATGWL